MARDPSKKGIRKIPPTFLEWISSNYGPNVAKWYKTTTGTGKAEATKQRQSMSEMAGSVGGFHEGHFQGAKDIDPEMGGGPTTGRTLRPEIGITNVAHAEMPRMSKADMKRLGIPQYWIEDFYEAILESEGKKVIGNLDVQGSLDVDRGMPPEQAAAQTRVRDDLRAQGENIPGARYTATDKPAPISQLPAKQPQAPKFDATKIKTGSGIPVVTGGSRISVPQNPVKFNKGIARFVPGVGLAVGLSAIGEQAKAGNVQGVLGESISTVVGEVLPVIGDVAVLEAEGRPAGAGSDITDPKKREEFRKQQYKKPPLYETAGTMLLQAGQQALENPMLSPITTPIKAVSGAIRFFSGM